MSTWDVEHPKLPIALAAAWSAGRLTAAALHRAAGEPVRALACEISVSFARSYAGRLGEAAVRMPDLLDRVVAAGNPSMPAWAHFVTGEAEIDTDQARAAYAAAAEHAAQVSTTGCSATSPAPRR